MEEQPIVTTKKIRAPHRYMEDGKYNSKPLDPEYFNTYYHKRTELVQCQKCGLECKRNYLYKHSLTNKCRKLVDMKAGDANQV